MRGDAEAEINDTHTPPPYPAHKAIHTLHNAAIRRMRACPNTYLAVLKSLVFLWLVRGFLCPISVEAPSLALICLRRRCPQDLAVPVPAF